jgi:ketosteroid isomerase-like protein
MKPQSIEARNLAAVQAHFDAEAGGSIGPALDLYTDDVVWEAPARNISLRGKRAAAENYKSMFSSMNSARLKTLRRFATGDKVVDEGVLSFRMTGNGIPGAPLPAGTDVSMRVVHIFDMREGQIARESVMEMWPYASAEEDRAARSGTEKVMQLGLGFWGSKALLSAVELGVFTELGRGPVRAGVLAERLGLHQRGARDFFDSLVALGLLQRRGDIYSNAEETGALLDRSRDSYVGGMLEMANARLYKFWGSLTEALRTGQPQNEAASEGQLFEAIYSDPLKLKSFLQGMTGISMGAAKAIARKFPWQRYRTFVDIGAAQGAVPVQVSLTHDHISGGGFDLPVVKPIFEDYIRSFGLSERVRFHEGNFFTDALPSADVLIMGHILHDWNMEEKRLLLGKAYRALPPGGALLVYEALIDDERRHNAFGLLMSLNMLIETPGGFDYTGADCSAWMREAGFRETRVEHLSGPDSMVVGIK